MAIRNLVLVLAAIAALPLAIWRSKVAERQADTAQRGLLLSCSGWLKWKSWVNHAGSDSEKICAISLRTLI